MANKEYLDAEGLQRLKDYLDNQVESLKTAIDLLLGDEETPGSIWSMIDNTVDEITVINGGSAPDKEG